MELSSIIPTRNRAAFLKKTLQSITEKQAEDHLFEVIVVDNGSTDNTKDICYEEGKTLTNLVYCYDDEPGQLTVRHRGTELSQGKILSFIYC